MFVYVFETDSIAAVWVCPLLSFHHQAFDTEPDVQGWDVPTAADTMLDYRECVWPAPLSMLDDSVAAAKRMKTEGVDLVDCSTGGATRNARIPVGPGYQVPFAEQIRREAEIPTGAVGMITEPAQAEAILAEGRADLILLGRQLLREPYWAQRAWQELQPDTPAPIAREYAWALAETRRR